MSFSRSTDVVIDAMRTTLGSTLLVDSETAYIRRTPETDLYALPQVTTTNYPLVAIEDVSDEADAEPNMESAKTVSIGVTLAMHYVCRGEDQASGNITTPREYCRKVCEAMDAKIGAAPALGTSIIGNARWRGGGQELGAVEDLRAQGLHSHTTVWQFTYGTDRP